MPKYWGKQIFSLGIFPEVGQKQKTEKKSEKERKRRAKVGNNNGQLRIATPPRMAHAKPPGPITVTQSQEKWFTGSRIFLTLLSLGSPITNKMSVFHEALNGDVLYDYSLSC